ncbi:MAG TPA: SRPBCC domain-containing protein [Fimbriimonadaceae bacterium]|nr:SRPBCC domain-containing protein [Fimbriimonadaceae bacterium]
MEQLSSSPDRLIVQGHFSGFTPEEMFQHWVTPELLCKWWMEEAEVEPREGGKYRFAWPEMGWVLEGEYTEFLAPERLSFTWRWNHDPAERETLLVQVDITPAPEGGSVLTITHGPYSDSASDQEAKQGHLEGWIHFGMRLAGMRTSTA